MAKHARLRGRSYVMTREKARSILPILKWIKEAATRSRERVQAGNIIKKIQDIERMRQVILTKGEAELLSFIYTEFPQGVPPEEGKQLEMFTMKDFDEPTRFGASLVPRWKEQGLPPPTEKSERQKPALKKVLTPEELAEVDTTRRVGSSKENIEKTSVWNQQLLGGRD